MVTGTAAAFVLTAGIVGAVAVQPSGQEQDRDTTAAPAAPDALQGLPPMMVKREPVSRAGENGTVDVHSSPGRQNQFTYTPPPAPEYTPRHMADSHPDQPGSDFTVAPLPGIDFGKGAGPSSPTRPSADPTRPPTYTPTTPPTQSPRPTPTPTPTPDPTPTPTPTPTPEPTPTPTPEPSDPPSDEPSDPPSEEPTNPPSDEPTTEPTAEPTEEPTEEPSEEPSTEPSPEPSASTSPEPTE